MRNRLYSLTLLPLAAFALLAGQPKDVEPLTKEFKTETIDSLSTAMKESYVFPEVANKVAEDLKARLAKGEYDSVEKGADFAKLLTTQMNALCKDAHLNVRFSKEPFPKRANRAEPSAEEIAMQERRMRLMNGGIGGAERLVGNVGYIDTTNFMDMKFAKRPIAAAMELLADTDALIVDMRSNGGGSPSTVQFFCSYFFGTEPILLNTIESRDGSKKEFYTLKDLPGSRYLDKEVYVLCGKRTGSAAEEFCYNLKNLKRATLVGESTWGGANPGGFERLNDHFAVFIPHGRAVNPITKTNWEGTGVEPDVKATPDEAFKVAHSMAIKALLAKAEGPDKDRLTEALSLAEKGVRK